MPEVNASSGGKPSVRASAINVTLRHNRRPVPQPLLPVRQGFCIAMEAKLPTCFDTVHLQYTTVALPSIKEVSVLPPVKCREGLENLDSHGDGSLR